MPLPDTALLFLADPQTGRNHPAAALGRDWASVRDLDFGPDEAMLASQLAGGARLIASPGEMGESMITVCPVLTAAFGNLTTSPSLVV